MLALNTIFGERNAHLGAEAVSNGSNLGDSQLLERIDSIHDNRVDSRRRVRALAIGAVLDPPHDVEIIGLGLGHLVTEEQVRDQGCVAVGRVLVRQELAVCADAPDVGDVDDADTLMILVGWRRGEVGLGVVGDGDELASGFTSEKC